jgi:hypothetical protein
MLSHAKEGSGTSEERVARRKLVRQKPTLPVLPEVALQEPIIITNNGKYLWCQHVGSTVGNFMLLHGHYLSESSDDGAFSILPYPPITARLVSFPTPQLFSFMYFLSLALSTILGLPSSHLFNILICGTLRGFLFSSMHNICP